MFPMKRIVTILSVIALLLPVVSCRKTDTPLRGAGDEFVDLGLPSGILWKSLSEAEKDRGITFTDAEGYFSSDFDQWITLKDAEELLAYCTFDVRGRVRVTGPNGKSIDMVKGPIWTISMGPEGQVCCLNPVTQNIILVPEGNRYHIHLIKRPANQ